MTMIANDNTTLVEYERVRDCLPAFSSRSGCRDICGPNEGSAMYSVTYLRYIPTKLQTNESGKWFKKIGMKHIKIFAPGNDEI